MKYHKIQSLFKRDDKGVLIENDWSCKEFEALSDCLWVAEEKIDGTNVRIYQDKVQGRTDNAQFRPEVAEMLEERRKQISLKVDNYILYGEAIGPKIQGNPYNLKEHTFVLFDVFIGGLFLERPNKELVAKDLGMPIAPHVGAWNLSHWISLIRDEDQRESQLYPGNLSEGLVLRPHRDLHDRRGQRIISKLKYKDRWAE